MVLVLVLLSACARPVPGTPVLSPRVQAAVSAYQECRRAVAQAVSDVDGVLDAMDRAGAVAPDVAAIGRFYGRLGRTLDTGCGTWAVQGVPLSDIVVHLSGQGTRPTAGARAAAGSMIASICGSVEGPLDAAGVNLTDRAHAVCAQG